MVFEGFLGKMSVVRRESALSKGGITLRIRMLGFPWTIILAVLVGLYLTGSNKELLSVSEVGTVFSFIGIAWRVAFVPILQLRDYPVDI
jgi:hypothetical protein